MLLGKRRWVIIGSAILAGLILLVSGIVKLPGKTEFANVLLESFWTPGVAYFIAYSLPWVEICLGALLLLGILWRIAAAFCIQLFLGFMANNSWALNEGIDKFPACAHCFGKLENYLGSLSPLGALIFDVVLLLLVLGVLLLNKEGFLTVSPWFIRRREEVS